MQRNGYIYIMTNKYKNVLYIGVTTDLKKRAWQHRNHFYQHSFTDKYNVVYLVYYEGFNNIIEAIAREKQLKSWNRSKKNVLIESRNLNWKDLYDEIMEDQYSLF
jgi:putative endonuclease